MPENRGDPSVFGGFHHSAEKVVKNLLEDVTFVHACCYITRIDDLADTGRTDASKFAGVCRSKNLELDPGCEPSGEQPFAKASDKGTRFGHKDAMQGDTASNRAGTNQRTRRDGLAGSAKKERAGPDKKPGGLAVLFLKTKGASHDESDEVERNRTGSHRRQHPTGLGSSLRQ
ncbi:hypothetical protein SFA35_06230 [Pseudomonas sp. HR96]|uniref:hypothetical protein n=1 Tax=Pseudomonas sp. HR96 TaxID=1027966 RepID=UPI002A75B280|nr:hypothetical protein [Pseudomonas sp. HR96]WPP00961.1 hypothetical protein SFA35_06230 [Pseudomonas sp. HR96]